MTRSRRPSPQTVAVLRALATAPDRWRYGYDLCLELGLAPGSMYPILIRLADRGMLETGWETEHVPGRPARHLYRLTPAGRAYAAAAHAPDRAGAGSAAAGSAVADGAGSGDARPGRAPTTRRTGRFRPRLGSA